jgi:hypothetical protein
MQPTIYTVSADGTHIHSPSAMSDTTDNNQFGYQSIANNVASKFTSTRQESESMVKQIWNDFMDDIMGPKRGSSSA